MLDAAFVSGPGQQLMVSAETALLRVVQMRTMNWSRVVRLAPPSLKPKFISTHMGLLGSTGAMEMLG